MSELMKNNIAIDAPPTMNVDSNEMSVTTAELISQKTNDLDVFADDEIRKMNVEGLQEVLSTTEYLLGLDQEQDESTLYNIMRAHIDASGLITNPGCQLFSRMYSVMTTIMGRAHELESKQGQNILGEKTMDVGGKEMTFSERWNRNRTMLHYLDQATKAHTMFNYCYKNNGSFAEDSTEIWSMDPYDPTNLDGCNEFQEALFAILRIIWEKGYRRYHSNICKQIKTKEGYNTRAWEIISTIKKYTYGIVKKERQLKLWHKLSRNNKVIPNLADMLTNQEDSQFPDIEKCRYLWSFNNGLYYGKDIDKDGHICASFYPYESAKCLKLDPELVSAKYFDQDFVDYSKVKDWYDIPTPKMQSILDFQNFSKAHARWLYIMLGRLCYETDDLDNWQVVPFIKGIANSGKSTILTKICAFFYDDEDVKTMANNTEGLFGLSPFLNRFLIIAPEIKKDFKLEQAQFQSMVAADTVSVAIKREEAQSVKWTIPMILAGNEVPSWKDNGGSIMRRIVPFEFTRAVRDANTKLGDLLKSEIPTILQKCVRAYTETVREAGDKTFWKIAPKEILQAQKRVAAATNVLCEFLDSPMVQTDPTDTPKEEKSVMLFKEFKEELLKFCIEYTIPAPSRFTPGNADYWGSQFQSRDIEVFHVTEKFKYNGKTYTNNTFIRGISFAKQEVEDY